MMRREVYATTGPRMQVRFFGGFDFSADDIADLVKAGYTKGVPMGGDLKGGGGQAPKFLISALMDPESAQSRPDPGNQGLGRRDRQESGKNL